MEQRSTATVLTVTRRSALALGATVAAAGAVGEPASAQRRDDQAAGGAA